MPKVIHKQLTVRQVAALDKPGFYADGMGLYLQVTAGGHKSWVLRYLCNGRRRDMGLGSVRMVPLAEARLAAQAAHALIRQQLDPIDERDRKKTESTHAVQVRRVKFEEALDAYLRWRDLKGKHAISVANPIYTYIIPIVGKLSVADITPTQMYEALTTKAKSGKALWDLVIGDRTLPNLTGLFTYAIAKGWRENPINPADREQLKIVGLKAQKHEVKHFEACPYPRIPEAWERLQAFTDTAMMSLRWAVLNAARPKEARRLRWEWIDFENQTVSIPGNEMKGGRAHRIPYSTASAELLETMRAVRTCGWVFPNNSNQPYSADLFSMLARRVMPDIPGITAHGFRSSFSTWVTETTTFEADMREVALAHQVGDKVAQAYQRGVMLAKRRTMMETWAAYCQGKGIDRQFRSEFVVVAA